VTYLVLVVALMLVLPVTSSVLALGGSASEPLPAVLVRWFVFWGVGVRLLLAGIRQIVQPRYTAEEILGIEGEIAHAVIRELRFANVALGTLGVVSLVARTWAEPAGLAGAIFYTLAGVNHLRKADRNRNETVAMVSDLAFGGLLAMLTVGVRR
jgi:hypothetical protein